MASIPIHRLPFHNKYADHDFRLIYKTIKRYYPIESSKRYTAKNIKSSPGFKKIGDLMEEHFINRQNYRARWTKLNQFLKKEIRKPVHDTVSLSNCCYSGEVVLEEIKNEDFIKSKKLNFYVSVLGPFFSICGVDSTTIFLPLDGLHGDVYTGHFNASHSVTVSPVFEYASMFRLLEEKLRQFFPDHYFVPYNIGMSTIKNISVKDDLRDPRTINTVYEALFGRSAVHDCLPRGDRRYGFDDWVKPLTTKQLQLVDRIAENILNTSKKTTIHKVWKLSEYKRLEALEIRGNLMMGMDMLDVIDLTHETKGIVMSKGGRAPSQISYRLRNDIIQLFETLSLRIVDITRNTLTANLIVNFQHKETSLRGEAFEIKFIEMKNIDK